MKRSVFSLLALFGVIGMLCSGTRPGSAASDNKLKPEEVLAKHLDSLGTPEARKASRPRAMAGRIEVEIRSRGVAKGQGLCVLGSEGPMSVVKMDFGGTAYPYDRVGYDGSKVTASQVQPGVYSNLGSFVRSYPELLKDGLLGGALSTAWIAVNQETMGKLEYSGTKKINDRQAIELKYRPNGGSDLKISFFFDAETFQHVRSVYSRTISSQMSRGGLGGKGAGGGGATAAPPPRSTGPGSTSSGREGELSASQSETRYQLSEDFSDFKPEGGITLPHTYKIRFEQAGASSQFTDWVLTLNQFFFDEHLEPKLFDVSGG